MINTQETIKILPPKLRGFKKYIEKYECSILFGDNFESASLIFYHKSDKIPYVIVTQKVDSDYALIYVNREHEDLTKDDAKPKIENLITNDMEKFIMAIRECVESSCKYCTNNKYLNKEVEKSKEHKIGVINKDATPVVEPIKKKTRTKSTTKKTTRKKKGE